MKKRDFSLDVIRAIAIFFVVAIHFFLHSGFGAHQMHGLTMLALSLVRPIFITCVPLFLMLTGFLMNKKTYSVRYFFGIKKTLLVYVAASVACILFKTFTGIYRYTFVSAVKSIFNFTGANYAWYIKMYIILFLIFPLLNRLYRLRDTKAYKLVLIGFFLTVGSVVPAFFKGIAGGFFDGLYPLAYYFIGAYLSEYGLKLKKRFALSVIALTAVLEGAILYIDCYGERFGWQNYTYYSSPLTVVIAVMLFSFFRGLDYSRISEKPKRLILFVSDASLGAYLLSYIFDTLFYKYVTAFASLKIQLLLAPLVVTAVFVCSTLCSFAVNRFIKHLGSL